MADLGIINLNADSEGMTTRKVGDTIDYIYLNPIQCNLLLVNVRNVYFMEKVVANDVYGNVLTLRNSKIGYINATKLNSTFSKFNQINVKDLELNECHAKSIYAKQASLCEVKIEDYLIASEVYLRRNVFLRGVKTTNYFYTNSFRYPLMITNSFVQYGCKKAKVQAILKQPLEKVIKRLELTSYEEAQAKMVIELVKTVVAFWKLF